MQGEDYLVLWLPANPNGRLVFGMLIFACIVWEPVFSFFFFFFFFFVVYGSKIPKYKGYFKNWERWKGSWISFWPNPDKEIKIWNRSDIEWVKSLVDRDVHSLFVNICEKKVTILTTEFNIRPVIVYHVTIELNGHG